MSEQFIKRYPSKGENPREEGGYLTSDGDIKYEKGKWSWYDTNMGWEEQEPPEWWLEEVVSPSPDMPMIGKMRIAINDEADRQGKRTQVPEYYEEWDKALAIRCASIAEEEAERRAEEFNEWLTEEGITLKDGEYLKYNAEEGADEGYTFKQLYSLFKEKGEGK